MALELYQIILLIIVGAFVGIGMSFVGQTGQGLVMPIVLLLTGDVFLAIAINLLNDLITAGTVSITYIRAKEFKLRRDTLFLIIIALIIAFGGVLILFSTSLRNIYGWFIPLFVTVLGITFLIRGFPTADNLKKIIKNLSIKALRKDPNIDLAEISQTIENRFDSKDQIRGLIPTNSKVYYYLSLIFGAFMGINSGLFGGNSGMIIVIALILIYGYPLKKGVGTALILSVLVSGFTFIIYQTLGFTILKTNFFNLEISLFLAIGSITFGVLSSLFIQKLSAKVMGRSMGAVIASLGIIALIFYIIF
jgi:uncharacterized membrane protein YfcA